MTEIEFECFFKDNFQKLAKTAFGVVRDVDEARDVVQQCFLKLWDKRFDLDTGAQLEAYMHRAVMNTAINVWEKRKRLLFDDSELKKQPAGESASQESDPSEIQQKIKIAIEQLPEKCGIVFNMSRYDGLSNKEIAEALDISVKAVEKQITRALKELRVSLKPLYSQLMLLLISLRKKNELKKIKH